MGTEHVVTKAPKRKRPLPQRSSDDAPVISAGEDAAPMRWAGERKCGHRVPARVGPPLVAEFINPNDPPDVGPARFVVVDAEAGECPVCDDAQRMAVRDK